MRRCFHPLRPPSGPEAWRPDTPCSHISAGLPGRRGIGPAGGAGGIEKAHEPEKYRGPYWKLHDETCRTGTSAEPGRHPFVFLRSHGHCQVRFGYWSPPVSASIMGRCRYQNQDWPTHCRCRHPGCRYLDLWHTPPASPVDGHRNIVQSSFRGLFQRTRGRPSCRT